MTNEKKEALAKSLKANQIRMYRNELETENASYWNGYSTKEDYDRVCKMINNKLEELTA